jgi:peptidoglycan/xylan/chitin deacetylase (PgdA/CDA1 family)
MWLKLSILTHVAAASLFIARPQAWPLTLSLVAANHGLLLLGSLWPRSRLLGFNLRRLPQDCVDQVAITFDDGPDAEVTPRVLEILSAHGAKATFFCIAQRAQAHPGIMQAIVAAGHRVENHSYRHAGHFALFLPRAMGRDVARAQEILAALAGDPPRYFRAPVGMRNPAMGFVLAAQGLRLVSWTRRGLDSVTRDPERVLRRLTRGLKAGDILLLHDGSSALSQDGTPVVLHVLPRLLEQITLEGLTPVAIPAPETPPAAATVSA